MTTDTPVVDLDAWIGLPAGGGVATASRITVADLQRELELAGVDRAVAYHVVAREHAPAIGNALLLDELAGQDAVAPAFVLLPPYTDELPPLAQLTMLMRERGVRLARMFPSSELAGHRFALREWSVGTLLSALEEAGLSVAIDFSLFRRGEPPWDDVAHVAAAHPDLRIALPDVQGRNNRNLYALLDRFPNLHIGTGGLNVHTGIADICRRFGAHRMFLSSGWPTRSLGAARFVVDRAGLDPADRAQVLGGTALALLGAAPVPAVPA